VETKAKEAMEARRNSEAVRERDGGGTKGSE